MLRSSPRRRILERQGLALRSSTQQCSLEQTKRSGQSSLKQSSGQQCSSTPEYSLMQSSFLVQNDNLQNNVVLSSRRKYSFLLGGVARRGQQYSLVQTGGRTGTVLSSEEETGVVRSAATSAELRREGKQFRAVEGREERI